MLLYSVYDTKVGAYAPPFAVKHPMMAFRAFIDLASDPNSMVAKHPTDFCLMEMGHFNEETGACSMLPAPDNKGTASSFLAKAPSDAS